MKHDDKPGRAGQYATPGGALAASSSTAWFGHPRGLMTLFFTEMWERLSYYGMRAILVLFMTAAVAGENPGLGMEDSTATAIYGMYTALVYLLALPGGWVADKLWGSRKAVFVGGCIIAVGHFSLAVPSVATFYFGLACIVIGTGLLKPNISAMVGDLYPEGGARRDAGFSIYYMGINLGAFLGPLACGFLGETYNWHLGFSLAGIGMLAGLTQYWMTQRHLGSAGLFAPDGPPHAIARRTRSFYAILGGLGAVALLVVLLSRTGVAGVRWSDEPVLTWDIVLLAQSLTGVIVGVAISYFVYLFAFGGHTAEEKKRLGVIFWLFLLAAVFWSGFEQGGSSMNLFAERLTNRVIGGWEAPASWLQAVNPLMIVLMAPVFGALWTGLSARNVNPSIPAKFAMGLLSLSTGFFVVAWGAANATAENPAPATWLIVTYFLHTCGELALSPVGLSGMTKLAPAGRVGQMMGVWFMASSLGSLVAGLVAGGLESLPAAQLFRTVAMTMAAVGVVALLLSPVVGRLISGGDR